MDFAKKALFKRYGYMEVVNNYYNMYHKFSCNEIFVRKLRRNDPVLR